MSHLVNVHHLEDHDVGSDGSVLGGLNDGKPGIVMMQGSFCGHCQNAKPDFQKFADQGKYYAATIQIDGSESEKKLNNRLSKAFGDAYRGVPHYYKIDSSGKFTGHFTGGRTLEKLNAGME